jgi:hypothetical protein
MTFAGKSLEALEEIDRIRERLHADLDKVADLKDTMANTRLAIANAQAILLKLKRQSTVTEGDKVQINGVLRQLERVA